jgi:hypothetical protein
MEKSADNILYCFQDDPLRAKNEMKIGFCKTRRHGVITPRLVTIDPLVGLVGGSPVVMARQSKIDEEFAQEMGWTHSTGVKTRPAPLVKKARGRDEGMDLLKKLAKASREFAAGR